MIKYFCNMCGKEVSCDNRYRVRATCTKLHICGDDLDFCLECAKRVFGQETVDKWEAAHAKKLEEAAERKAKARGAKDA